MYIKPIIPINIRVKEPGMGRAQLEHDYPGVSFYLEIIKEDDGYQVYAYRKDEMLNFLTQFSNLLVKAISSNANVNVRPNRNYTGFLVNIYSSDQGLFIGYHGQTLDALETLISAAFNRHFCNFFDIIVDIGNYRARREELLIEQAKQIIRQIEHDHKARPMPGLLPKERRIIHSFLTNHPYLTTESKGEGNNRVLWILPKIVEEPKDFFKPTHYEDDVE